MNVQRVVAVLSGPGSARTPSGSGAPARTFRNHAGLGSLAGTARVSSSLPRATLVPRLDGSAPGTYRPWLVCHSSGPDPAPASTKAWHPAAASTLTTRPVRSPIV